MLVSNEVISFYESTNFATILITGIVFLPFVILCCCVSNSVVSNKIKARRNRVQVLDDFDTIDDPNLSKSEYVSRRPRSTYTDAEQ